MGGAISLEEDEDLASVAPIVSDGAAQARWAVDIARWKPRPSEWYFLLTLLSMNQRSAVTKLNSLTDRKRALVSRLLQRRCVCTAFGVDNKSIEFALTKGGKPYLDLAASGIEPRPTAPNFNFNVSHEGHLVVLVSEPVLLCGVDVSAPFALRGGPPLGDFRQIRDTFWWAKRLTCAHVRAAADARVR